MVKTNRVTSIFVGKQCHRDVQIFFFIFVRTRTNKMFSYHQKYPTLNIDD